MVRLHHILALLCIFAVNVYGDVTIDYSLKDNGDSAQEFRIYVSGQKMRVVSSFTYRSGGPITIELLKDFATNTQYILEDGEYQKTSLTMFEDALSKERNARHAWGIDQEEQARMARHGTVTHFMHVRDTGERRSILGFVAKHLIIKSHDEYSADACSRQPSAEIVVDGWYTDPPPGSELLENQLPYWLEKPFAHSGKANDSPDLYGCLDKHLNKLTGDLQDGMPLAVRRTITGGAFSMDVTVKEFSTTPLKPELFSLPNEAKPQPEEQTDRLTSENVKWYRQWVPADMRICFGPVDTRKADREVNTSKMMNRFAMRLRDLGFVPVELSSNEPEIAKIHVEQQHCDYRLELELGLDGVPDDENDPRPAYDDHGFVPYHVYDKNGTHLAIYSAGSDTTLAGTFESVADNFMMRLAEYNRAHQKRGK